MTIFNNINLMLFIAIYLLISNANSNKYANNLITGKNMTEVGGRKETVLPSRKYKKDISE